MPKIAEHMTLLVPTACVTLALICLSASSPHDSSNSTGSGCVLLSEDSRRDLATNSGKSLVIIRPHSCLSCSKDGLNLQKVLLNPKYRFLCLLDSDSTESDIKYWTGLSVNTRKRDTVNMDLRRLTLGVYLVAVGGDNACKVDINAL